MKKILCVFMAVLMAGTALFGCGAETVPESTSQAETGTSAETEHTVTEETGTSAGTEYMVTDETVHEGISSYCRWELGLGTAEGSSSAYLEMGEETETEFRMIFHSYTGTLTKFYVDKASGMVRMMEYVPALDKEEEAGTFSLFDYLGREDPEEPSFEVDTEESTEAKAESHYVFRPKVCCVYMEEVFGKTMCETWYRLVDAVLAGKDTFECPDDHTYNWVMGQFPERCFPVLTELIDLAYDRENPVKDGVASFTWLVPPEEAAKRIEEFGKQIEGILNEVFEDDYSDLEKVLALYHYFSWNYEYDYETFNRMYQEYVDLHTIDFFKNGMGVCQQISTAYSYLLMQAGVEATVMLGKDHQWSYVRINGKDYHIDPTYVISEKDSLAYFMMTDEQRGKTGFEKACYKITSHYSEDHEHRDYAADDETFSPLWERDYGDFSHRDHILFALQEGENGEWDTLEFNYAGY